MANLASSGQLSISRLDKAEKTDRCKALSTELYLVTRFFSVCLLFCKKCENGQGCTKPCTFLSATFNIIVWGRVAFLAWQLGKPVAYNFILFQLWPVLLGGGPLAFKQDSKTPGRVAGIRSQLFRAVLEAKPIWHSKPNRGTKASESGGLPQGVSINRGGSFLGVPT